MSRIEEIKVRLGAAKLHSSPAFMIPTADVEYLLNEALAEAWDEGAVTAWESSGEGWNGEYPGEPFSNNEIPNPYRSKP